MVMPTADASWRDTARYPKFFFFDSRAVFPLFFVLLHIRIWTIVVALIAVLFFSLLIRFGFTIAIFGRFIRALVAGPRKVAKPWWA